MAADKERPKKRKMTDHGVTKLLPGEEVEVLYSEEGLKGSWHFGVVIDCGMFFRTIELANLLNEDNSSKLVDTVPVTAAIEGFSIKVPKLHRNWIRPLPPKYKINATEIRYGLCVDAFVDDAWWEGVVFDHNEGSLERLIFFPDQGDQQVVSFESLRITQEWNEASGQWKHRGKWKFLQVIQTFEREGPLPVSVREIWYDLRSVTSFLGKVGAWISGSKSMWQELVAELIQELLSVVNGLQVEATIPYNELCEKPMNIGVIDCPREFLPDPDGQFLQENAGRISSLSVTSRKEAWEHVLIMSCGNEPNTIHHSSSHLKQCDYDLKSSTVDGMHCDSHGKAHDGWQEMAQTNCLNSSSVSNNLAGLNQGAESKDITSGITALQSSETWKLMDIEAENCAEAITLLLQDLKDGDCEVGRSKSHDKKLSSLRLKAKRHLAALGWSIEAKKNHQSFRVRFVSPNGRLYYSLRSACFGLLGRQPEKNGKQKLNNVKSLDGFHFVSSSSELLSMNSGGETDYGPHDNALNVLLPVLKKNQMEDPSHVVELNVSNWETKTSTNLQSNCKLLSVMTESDEMPNNCVMNDKSSCDFTDERHANSGRCSSKRGGLVSRVSKQVSPMYKDIEPEQLPGAVTQYIDYRNSRCIAAKNKSVVDANLIKLNAKKHLLFMGWRLSKTNSAFIYVSPIGKSFRSLYTACKALFDEENSGVGTSRPLLNGKTRRRLEYLSREMKTVNNGKKHFRRVCRCATTTDEENIHEAFKVLQNVVEKGYADSSKCAESTARSVPQMPSKGCRVSRKRRMTSSACQYLDHKLLRHSGCCSSACAKAERSKALPGLIRKRHSLSSSSSCRVRRTSKRSRELDALSPSQHASRTVLSLLIENDVVLPRQKVMYICEKDGHIMIEGRITGEGIKCKCCSKVHTLSNFEVHAGSTLRRPAANIFLKDGRSLLQCQIQMLSSKIPVGFQRSRLKSNCSIYQSDSICSVCHDGGSLVLCDHCPSSFHLECVGLEDVPEDKWFCSSCRCHICGMSEFNPDTEQFTDKTVLYCDQCEHQYHVGCMQKREGKSLQSCPPGNWFCSRSCSKIFLDLRKLVGISKQTAVEGLSCTILRSGRDYRAGYDLFDSEVQAEHHSKLFVALKVLHECFVTIIEPRTQSDLVADILFNKESELKRLNFYGFYTMLLEKGDELISVATFRIYGEKIAEMPLIGTRIKYRRQGMCRLLVGELEKLLVSVGVERFLLPAVPQLLETWISSFGFAKMSNSDRLNLLDYFVLNFQDTTMCQKLLRVAPVAHSKPRDNSNSNISNIDPGQESVLALPCFGAKSSPMFTATGNNDQTNHQTSCAHSIPSNKFIEPAGQAMWNEMKQTAIECVINCHSS